MSKFADEVAGKWLLALGHRMESWEPSGIREIRARCLDCGLEAVVSYTYVVEKYDLTGPATEVHCQGSPALAPRPPRTDTPQYS